MKIPLGSKSFNESEKALLAPLDLNKTEQNGTDFYLALPENPKIKLETISPREGVTFHFISYNDVGVLYITKRGDEFKSVDFHIQERAIIDVVANSA